jgi:aromatic ring hydroxylase
MPNQTKTIALGVCLVGCVPFTRAQHDRCEAWICRERLANVAARPAFSNSARIIAWLYGMLHHWKGRDILSIPAQWGGITWPFFHLSRSTRDQLGERHLIDESQRTRSSWQECAPKNKGAFLANLSANTSFYRSLEHYAILWWHRGAACRLDSDKALALPGDPSRC